MYAHQVIEALKTFSTSNVKMKELISVAAHGIQIAQKFHLGDISTQGIVDGYTGKHLFDDPSRRYVNFPYEKVWVDWADNHDKDMVDIKNEACFPKKSAALIITLDNQYHNILLFNFIGMWLMTPIVFNLYLSSEHNNFVVACAHLPNLSPELEKGMGILEKESNREITVLNMFLEILNCKNISTIDNPPPERLNKKRVKNGKQPLFTYKTLVIKPTSKKQVSQEAQGLWENRVHLCRGHFKTYTEKNPLFGSHTGRYWWQSSVRGNKAKGVVMKDYEVRVA